MKHPPGRPVLDYQHCDERSGCVLGVLHLSRAGGPRPALTQRNQTVRLQRLQEDLWPRRQSGAAHERALAGTAPCRRMFYIYTTIKYNSVFVYLNRKKASNAKCAASPSNAPPPFPRTSSSTPTRGHTLVSTAGRGSTRNLI